MAEYIEREALETALNHRLNFLMAENGEYDHYTSGFDEAVTRVEDFPSADVAPVRHGRWEYSTDEWFETDVYTCSKCRESYVLVEGTPKENLWNYCPNCGAKMDGNWKQTT